MKVPVTLFYFLVLFGSIINAQTTVTWNGNQDNDWHKDCNWSTGLIPTCIQDVVIPTTSTVDVSGIAHCKTIALQGTADINITGSAKLEVSDNNSCVGTATNNGGCVTNLLPNPSFEDYSCCPSGNSQMSCVDDWYQYTSGTSDYFNTCGWPNVPGFNPPPSPLPDGTGYTGFHDCNDKEYIAVCPTSTLTSGTSYTLEFKISSPSNTPFGTTVGIFRLIGGCGSTQLTTTDRRTGVTSPFYSCLTFGAMGAVATTPDNTTWKTYSFTFTPPTNVTGIAIGPACGGYGGACNGVSATYYYLDDLVLYEN